MDIKMIAVDMDGTFLNSEKTYDRPRFEKLLDRMDEKGIRFVCASGNQLPKLEYYFEGLTDRMTFVAENGAYIIHKGEVLYSAVMSTEMVQKGIDALQAYSDTPFLLCGVNGSYLKKGATGKYADIFRQYYLNIEEVNNLHEIEDEILSFTTIFQITEVSEVLDYLEKRIGKHLSVVGSGFGFVDILLPDVHKGLGMKLLQERWNISVDACAAFGDSPNDIEMLKQVTHGYAMANAEPSVKAVAKYEIADHNTTSLLDTIEQLIGL